MYVKVKNHQIQVVLQIYTLAKSRQVVLQIYALAKSRQVVLQIYALAKSRQVVLQIYALVKNRQVVLQIYALVKNRQVVLQIYPLVKNRQVVLQIYAPVNVPIKKDVLRGASAPQSIEPWRRVCRTQIHGLFCWSRIHRTWQSQIRRTRIQGHIVRRLTALYTSIGSLPCKKNMPLL